MKKIFLIYFLFAFFGIASCKKNENFNIDKLPWLKEKISVFSNDCTRFTRVYKGSIDGTHAYRLESICCELCDCSWPIFFEDGKIPEGLQNDNWYVQNPNPQLVYECGKK